MWAVPRLLVSCLVTVLLSTTATRAVILQNGQVRETHFPDTRIDPSETAAFTTYAPDAPELSYHGRWDAKHVSWWS